MSDEADSQNLTAKQEVAPTEIESASSTSIETAFASYIDRLIAGETITQADIRCEHPELEAEILEQLRLFSELSDDHDGAIRPQRIGDFEIIREIGRGGMGIVCEAVQISLGRRVALKIVPAGMAVDPKTIARFVREAQLSAKLDHPNVVTVYEMGFDQHVPYYAMEFVEGETLAARLKRYKVEATQSSHSELQTRRYYIELAAAFAGAADGLVHAHSRGIVHRDLKPSNLIFDGPKNNCGSELLRILDFGLAQVEGHETLTASGDLVGSVRYMSPEQASVSSRRTVDHRTDIYSLGATFYEALTLQPPFQGKDIQDTLVQIQSKEIKHARRINPRVPIDLETIATKCLRKEPNDRYGSAEALSQDLKRFLRGDMIEAKPVSAVERTTHWIRQNVVRLILASCFLGLVTIATFAWISMLMNSHRLTVIAYPAKIQQASDIIHGVNSSAQANTGIDLFLVPAGYSYAESRFWISNDANPEQIQQSISILDGAVLSLPGHTDAYWHRARAHLLNQDVDSALADLDKLLEVDPQHVPGRLLMAEIHRHIGEFARASEIRGRAASLAKQSVYRDWWQAQNLAKKRYYREAAASFKAALKANLANPPYIGWEREVKLAIAICHCRCREYELAVRYLNEESDDNRLQLAIAYYGMGSELAITEANRMLAELSKNASNHVAVVAVREYQRLYSRGKITNLDWELLEGWIQKMDSPAIQSRMRSICFLATGRYDAGVAEAERAIQLAPNDPEGHYFLAGDIFGSYDLDNPRILRLLDKAIELAPTSLEYQACRIYNAARHADAKTIPAVLEIVEDLERRSEPDPQFWTLLFLGITRGELARYCDDRDIHSHLAEANRLLDMASKLQHNSWLERNRAYMYRRLARHTENLERKQEYLRLAIAEYEKVLNYPYLQSFSTVYLALSSAYSQLDGDNKRAIQTLLDGWNKIPVGRRKDPRFAFRLWQVHSEHEPVQAVDWLTTAIQLDCQVGAYQIAARSIFTGGDEKSSPTIEGLRLDLEKLLRDPQVDGEGRTRLLATLAVAYDAEGNNEKAHEYATRVRDNIRTYSYDLCREWAIAHRVIGAE